MNTRMPGRAAEHEMARLGRRAAVVDPRRAGRDDWSPPHCSTPVRVVRGTTSRPVRDGSSRSRPATGTGRRGTTRNARSYPVGGVPMSPVGPFDVTNAFPSSSNASPKGLRRPPTHDGASAPNGLSARNRPVGVVAQDLAADVVRVLRAPRLAPHGRLGHRVLVAEGHVELAVLPEREPATLVAAVVARRAG